MMKNFFIEWIIPFIVGGLVGLIFGVFWGIVILSAFGIIVIIYHLSQQEERIINLEQQKGRTK